jgi:carnitine 3-dehydrogenase
LPEHVGTITSLPLAEAIDGAGWVQESLPERIDLKRKALAAIERRLANDAIVASSTSTLTASVIAEGFSFAPRLMVAHPLHPVYVVPIVELSAGALTEPAAVHRAAKVLRALGREPVVVRGEPPGLVANRLTAALLREALELVANGVISPSGLDRVVARGIATGWAAVGPFATEMVGRGDASTATSERAWAELLARILDAANRRLTPDARWTETPSRRAD